MSNKNIIFNNDILGNINKSNIYNLYVDESATIKNKDANYKVDNFFIVGGYLVKSIEPLKWNEKLKDKLNELIKDYNIPNNEKGVIYHRTELRKKYSELSRNITNVLFDYIYKYNAKFVYMYDNNTDNIYSTKYYYINFIALLVVKTLIKIIEENKYLGNNKIILNVIYASRLDVTKDKNKDIKKQIEKNEIDAGIMENIEKLRIKYGLLNNNIEINLSCKIAKHTPELVVADYFCNRLYGYYKNGKKNMTIPKENILLEIPYSTFDNDIEIYLDKKDYYYIINKYIFYKKISKSKLKNKEYANFYIEKIENYIKNDKHSKRNRYLIIALKSLLENIEYESNSLHSYNNIIDTYNILIEFFRQFIEKDLLNAIIFTINTEKLSVYNHTEDYNNALKVIEENNNFINYIVENSYFKDRLILFGNLSSVFHWHKYNPLKSIELIKENLSIFKSKYSSDFKEEIAKLYGTLGQAYIINYYITNNEEELIEAENCFNESINILLSISSKEVLREYNYLMLLYTIKNNEDKFIEYLSKYLNLFNNNRSIGTIDLVDLYIKNEKERDKSYKYFIIRLLKYCNSFNTNNSKKISDIIISNQNNFILNKREEIVEDIDIKKEYSLLCYKNSIVKNYINDCHKFMENQTGYFNDMRRLSLYIIEILMDNDSNFNEAIRIIEYLSSVSEGYQQTFSSLLEESKNNNLNKKDWALKVRNKLYM